MVLGRPIVVRFPRIRWDLDHRCSLRNETSIVSLKNVTLNLWVSRSCSLLAETVPPRRSISRKRTEDMRLLRDSASAVKHGTPQDGFCGLGHASTSRCGFSELGTAIGSKAACSARSRAARGSGMLDSRALRDDGVASMTNVLESAFAGYSDGRLTRLPWASFAQ